MLLAEERCEEIFDFSRLSTELTALASLLRGASVFYCFLLLFAVLLLTARGAAALLIYCDVRLVVQTKFIVLTAPIQPTLNGELHERSCKTKLE
jgi:hypothetical protein